MRASKIIPWGATPLQVYQKFLEFVNGSRTGEERKLCSNVMLWKLVQDESVVFRYYATDIMTFRKDGAIEFDIRGWFCPHTMKHIRSFGLRSSQFNIWGKNGEHYWFHSGDWKDPIAPYTDGDTIWCDELFHSRTMKDVPIPPKRKKEKAPEPVAQV